MPAPISTDVLRSSSKLTGLKENESLEFGVQKSLSTALSTPALSDTSLQLASQEGPDRAHLQTIKSSFGGGVWQEPPTPRSLVKQLSRWDGRSSCIEPWLYLGGLKEAYDKDMLKEHNITHIVSLAGDDPPFPADFKYLEIKGVRDTGEDDLSAHWVEAFDMIDEARKQGTAALVHCYGGTSRSPTIVIAYLMERKGLRLSEALYYVTLRRPMIRPREGFLKQLKELDYHLAHRRPWQRLVSAVKRAWR